jgi:hypothetical protein
MAMHPCDAHLGGFVAVLTECCAVLRQVQLQHNKRKSEALRELLASTDATAAEAVAAAAAEGEDVTSSSTVRARESCSKATAALQDLLDELLLNSSNAAGGEQ